MTVYEAIADKIGDGSLELSDLDELRNAAKTHEELVAVATLVDKVQRKQKIDGYDLAAVQLAFPEKKVEKAVEKLEEAEKPAQTTAQQREVAKSEPVRKDV